MVKAPNREKYEIYDQNIVQKMNGEQVDESVKKVFLRGNPFLYNLNNANMGVTSIEEYYVKFCGEEKTFGEVVRCRDYSKFKRKRFVKKTLKDWKKEYLKTRDKTIEENLGAVELIGEINTLKFRNSLKLLLIVILVLIIFISSLSTGWFLSKTSSEFINQLSIIIINSFSQVKFIKIINYISLYLLIIALIYSFLYNVISKDFRVFYKTSKNVLSNAHYHLARDYKKKYTRVRKYYISGIKKNLITAPYDIRLVGEGKENLKMFEDISSATVVRARNFKNKKIFFIIIKYILSISSIALSSVVIVYFAYQLIKNLLF